MKRQVFDAFLLQVLVVLVAGFGPKFEENIKPEQPKLLMIPSSEVVERGQDISFLCLTNSVGHTLKSEFLKDGLLVPSGDSISLEIPHATGSDSGRYSCRVEVDGLLSEPSTIHDLLVVGGSYENKPIYKSLHKEIMRKSSLALPQTRVNRPVKVKLRVALTEILEVDTDNNVITLVLRKEETWSDPCMAWSLSQYNVTEVVVRAPKMWVPDLVPYNLVSRVERLSPPLIVLLHNGTLISVQILKLSIDSDTTGYDTYSGASACITFGSWNYHGELLELKEPTDTSFSVCEFSKTSKYEILESPQACERCQSVCSYLPQSYQYIKFHFVFRLKGKRLL